MRFSGGSAYKLVFNKFNKTNLLVPGEANRMLEIVNHLFPSVTDPSPSISTDPVEWSPELDGQANEILALARGMKLGKAPGPDGLPDDTKTTGIRYGLHKVLPRR